MKGAEARLLRWSGAAAIALVLVAALALANGRFEPLPASSGEPGAAGRVAALSRELERLSPDGTFAVIDTYANRVRIYRGEELLREAVCSTGTGYVLRDAAGGREWTFDTPLGERRVVKKTRNPVWIKPDWAFVEEGYEPPASASARVDDLSLGDYGIYLGDGYLIHGTLFKSLLGQKVTHGCIRMGDEDLEFLYRVRPVGGRVLLY